MLFQKPVPTVAARLAQSVCLTSCLVTFLFTRPVNAQAPVPVPVPVPLAFQAVPGTAWERYVRTLDVIGWTEPLAVGIRGWSRAQLGRPAGLSEVGPWDETYSLGFDGVSTYGWLPARSAITYNTGFPFQRGGGPVWYGRGATAEVRAGAYLRAGPLTVVLNPTWFRAENRTFALAATGFSEEGRFRNPLLPRKLDMPQRYGEGSYGRLDAGSSAVSVEAVGVIAGLSSAPQQWGPGDEHPLVLGAGGGGFPHVFMGTSRPIDAWIARLHARYMAGRITQTAFFGNEGDDRLGLLNGLVLVVEPRGFDGLEVGVARLFHYAWPDGKDLGELLRRPFEGLWKSNLEGIDERVDDQFASVFFRWAHRTSGFELFGEFVRVDHSWDVRTLALEPEDQAGYMLGFRRVWRGGEGRLTALRGEVITSGSTHRERGGARVEKAYEARPIYSGVTGLGGLTHHGQLLATTAGPFGNGQSLGLDRYSRTGRWSLELERRVVRDRTLGEVADSPADVDVMHVLGGEWVRFRGAWELEVGGAAVYELNRHLEDDAFSLNLRVGLSRRLH